MDFLYAMNKSKLHKLSPTVCAACFHLFDFVIFLCKLIRFALIYEILHRRI